MIGLACCLVELCVVIVLAFTNNGLRKQAKDFEADAHTYKAKMESWRLMYEEERKRIAKLDRSDVSSAIDVLSNGAATK